MKKLHTEKRLTSAQMIDMLRQYCEELKAHSITQAEAINMLIDRVEALEEPNSPTKSIIQMVN